VAVRPILTYPDPALRCRALPVGGQDASIDGIIGDLVDTLAATGGIGLSAPQLGIPLRIAVTEPSGGSEAPRVYVDPEILTRAAPGLVEESCLSVPGVVGSVWRHTRIRVRARGLDGGPFERDLEGMAAVCLQHELDHLDGVLFIDRLWLVKRLLVRARLDRRARQAAAA
jgi:peptide deformylase